MKLSHDSTYRAWFRYFWNYGSSTEEYLSPYQTHDKTFYGNSSHLAGIYRLKINNRNTGATCEKCSELIIKTLERRQWCRSGFFIVNFEPISFEISFWNAKKIATFSVIVLVLIFDLVISKIEKAVVAEEIA